MADRADCDEVSKLVRRTWGQVESLQFQLVDGCPAAPHCSLAYKGSILADYMSPKDQHSQEDLLIGMPCISNKLVLTYMRIYTDQP